MLLIVAGCNPTTSVAPTPEPTTATAEATVAINSHSNTSSAITTYVDKRSGIAFDYPNGWTIVAPTDVDAVIYTYTIASYNIVNPSQTTDKSESSTPNGETKIDVSFYGADETPESARRTVQADVDSGMAVVIKEETRTAVDGSKAYYYAIQGRLGGAAQVLYTRVNGHTVGVVAYGEGTNFDAVVKSLRAG